MKRFLSTLAICAIFMIALAAVNTTAVHAFDGEFEGDDDDTVVIVEVQTAAPAAPTQEVQTAAPAAPTQEVQTATPAAPAQEVQTATPAAPAQDEVPDVVKRLGATGMEKSSTVVPAKPETVEPEPTPEPTPTPTPIPTPTPTPTPTPEPTEEVVEEPDVPPYIPPKTGIEERREVVNTSAKVGVPNTGDDANIKVYTYMFAGSIILTVAAGIVLASKKEEEQA